MTDKNDEKSVKTNYIFRTAAGLYLLYLSASMVINFDTKSKYVVIFFLCIIVFGIVGLILAVTSIKSIIQIRNSTNNKAKTDDSV